MSGSTTPNYGFALPIIGGNQDTWGNLTNSNWSALDGFLHTLTGGTGPTGSFLPSTGGTISGNMIVTGAVSTSTLGVSGGAQVGTLNVQGATYFAGAQVTDFSLSRSFPQRILEWATNVTDVYDEQNGNRYWNSNTPTMGLSYGGNLTLTQGTGFQPGGGPWGAASDERVKRNVVDYNTGLEEVCRLRPIAYAYNGEGRTVDDGKVYIGLSAQATQSVMPELVFEMVEAGLDGSIDPRLLPGQLGTNLGPLTLALVNCVRELAERVAALEIQGA